MARLHDPRGSHIYLIRGLGQMISGPANQSWNAWSTRYLRWPCPTPGMVCHVQEMELWCNSAHWTYKITISNDQFSPKLNGTSHHCSTSETLCSSIPLHSCENGNEPFVACAVATTASSMQEKKQTALCTHYATGYFAPRKQRPRSQAKYYHEPGLDGITIGLEQPRESPLYIHHLSQNSTKPPIYNS